MLYKVALKTDQVKSFCFFRLYALQQDCARLFLASSQMQKAPGRCPLIFAVWLLTLSGLFCYVVAKVGTFDTKPNDPLKFDDFLGMMNIEGYVTARNEAACVINNSLILGT
jgi:hypothetical protein